MRSSRSLESRSSRAEADALVREQDLQALARHRARRSGLEHFEQVHAALRPNRRLRKGFLSIGIASGTGSPASRRAASL